MADLIKTLGDGKDGWNLTTKQAETLHAAGKIAAPTIVALKNHFLNKVLIPKLQELATSKGLQSTASSREISNLRDGIPEITVNGNKHDLINLNKLWTKVKKNTGKPLGNASSYLRDDYRGRAGKGFDENSLRLANFYDEIDNLRAIRDRDLSGTFNIYKVYDKFNQDMRKLFHKNRRWLPKVQNRPIKYNPSEEWKYGWQEGKNRQGFLDSQTSVYDLSTDQARWLANKLGIKQDAGHIVPLGGMIISDAERQKFFIDKSELEELPNNKWLLRGTNALTNLAIEDAKGNRAKGNLSGRQLEEIIQMNTAFTKSRSLLEYNLSGDKTFRKVTDFPAVIQSLFGHGDRDINELQAIAENQLLQTGTQITPTLPKNKVKSQKGLIPKYTQTEAGPVTSYTQRLDNKVGLKTVGVDGKTIEPSWEQTYKTAYGDGAAVWDKENPSWPAGVANFGLKQSLNIFGQGVGKPDLGDQVYNASNLLKSIVDQDVVGATTSIVGLSKQDYITQVEEVARSLAGKNY